MPNPITCPYKINTSNLRRGAKHHNTRLDEETVRAIRKECAEAVELREKLRTLSMRAIGERYGIAAQTVYEINAGITWAHVA